MQIDDQNPEEGEETTPPEEEAEDEQEAEDEDDEQEPANLEIPGNSAPAADPLDAITDPDELRRIAKKERAIRQRHKEPKPITTPTPPAQADTSLKADLEKAQERNAIRELQASADETDKEIVANWAAITKHYRSTRGRMTKEDIREDILDAHAVWKRNAKPADTSKEATAELNTIAGTGGRPPKPAAPERKSILPKNEGMDKWYGDGE